MNKINVRYSDNIDFTEALVHNSIINEGYIYPLAERKFDACLLDKFIDEFTEYNVQEYDFSDKVTFFKQYKSNEFILDISRSIDKKIIYVTFYCKSLEISNTIFRILTRYESNVSEMEIYCTTYSMGKTGVETNFKVYTIEDYKDTNNLYTPYIEMDIMFEQFYSNKENILILCGKPGVGKTSVTMQLLKYSLENPSTIPYIKSDFAEGYEHLKIAYVKSTDVLTEDTWWSTLAQEEYDLIILDDLDYFLTSRAEEVLTENDVKKNKFINQFLSFTDGIEKNKTKFLITTNQEFDDIDSALTRKGRLFDILELRELTNKEAKDIWISEGLNINDFKFTGNVLQSDLGSEIFKLKDTKVSYKPYLNDISVSKLTKKHKKLGF